MSGKSDAHEVADAHPERKRTRRGENFLRPEAIKYHPNDFTFESLVETEESKRVYNDYVAALQAAFDKYYGSHKTHVSECARVAAQHLPVEARVHSAPSDVHPSAESAVIASEANGGGDQAGWDLHYKQNSSHFFPIKNYIIHAFPSLWDPTCASTNEAENDEGSSSTEEGGTTPVEAQPVTPSGRVILECGCGSGSAALPLMKLFPRDKFILFDISAHAVELLSKHPVAQHHYTNGLLTTFVCDVSNDNPGADFDAIPKHSVDRILLIFVLSAVPIERMVIALQRLRELLKPNGQLLFRDYAIMDHNLYRFQERPNAESLVSDGIAFLKSDGTRQVFFELGFTTKIFARAGLRPLTHEEVGGPHKASTLSSVEYHCNRVVNRKNGKSMHKVFVTGAFGPM